jgi:hypothetical protein
MQTVEEILAPILHELLSRNRQNPGELREEYKIYHDYKNTSLPFSLDEIRLLSNIELQFDFLTNKTINTELEVPAIIL